MYSYRLQHVRSIIFYSIYYMTRMYRSYDDDYFMLNVYTYMTQIRRRWSFATKHYFTCKRPRTEECEEPNIEIERDTAISRDPARLLLIQYIYCPNYTGSCTIVNAVWPYNAYKHGVFRLKNRSGVFLKYINNNIILCTAIIVVRTVFYCLPATFK